MAKTTQDPSQVRNYLTGVNFPAKKDDIVRAARDQNAPDEVLQNLKNLPDREFRQVNEVTQELERR